MDLILHKLKPLILLFAFCLFSITTGVHAQQRPEPLSNPYLRTDMNANQKDITNINRLVFIIANTNIAVDASTFLTTFNGESFKLVNENSSEQYLIISNNLPYLVTSNSIRGLTLQGDTFYIRQFEPNANITNLSIWANLVLENNTGINDSDFGLNRSDLTNGTIPKLSTTSLEVNGRLYDYNSPQNFSYTNSVIGSNPITNTVRAINPNTVEFHEWTYIAHRTGKIRAGKLLFTSHADGSITRIVGGSGITNVTYSLDSEMTNHVISVLATNNVLRVILSGEGTWSIYGFSRGFSL